MNNVSVSEVMFKLLEMFQSKCITFHNGEFLISDYNYHTNKEAYTYLFTYDGFVVRKIK